MKPGSPPGRGARWLRQATLVVLALCSVELVNYWIASYSKGLTQELQDDLLAEQRLVLRNAVQRVQQALADTQASNVKELTAALEAKRGELRRRDEELRAKQEEMQGAVRARDGEVEKRDRAIEARDARIELLDRLMKELEGALALQNRRIDEDALGDFAVFRHHLSDTVLAGTQARWPKERGIVMCTGRGDLLLNAFVVAHVVRNHLKSSLPITIMYVGSFDKMTKETLEYMQRQVSNLELVDVESVPYPYHHRWLWETGKALQIPDTGYKLKVFAIYAAPYKEVLFLDNEALPLLKPEILFETEEYRRHGNMFWPDDWCKNVSLYPRMLIDDPWKDEWKDPPVKPQQAETGQLLLNKHRHVLALEWAMWFNTHDSFTYRYTFGDKNTFRAAFILANAAASYYQVPHMVSYTAHDGGVAPKEGTDLGKEGDRRLGNVGRIQYTPNGVLMFHHRLHLTRFNCQSDTPVTFDRLLYQPNCDWAWNNKERDWTYWPRPDADANVADVAGCAPHLDMHTLHTSCNITYRFPTSSPQDTPLVLKVSDGSNLQQVQSAAYAVFAAVQQQAKSLLC